jgi:hypothetical protein
MKIIPLLIVVLSCSYFALLASRHIAIPGLYYDEVLFVNAATGGTSPSFVSRRIFGVPVMLMSYIGALKAYFYFPIFKLFGVSAVTIRLPVILISLISLWMVFIISRLYFNTLTSAIVVSLVAFDPIFIFMTKLDFGPIVFMMVLKLLVLFFFIKTVTTRSTCFLWPLVISCILGLYDKLNFIWFIIALGVSAAILFRAELSSVLRHQRFSSIALPMALLIITILGSSVLTLRLLMQTQKANVSLWDRISYALTLYAISMNGGELYTRVLDSQLPSGTMTNYVTGLALVIMTIAGLRILVQKQRGRAVGLSFLERMMACYLILFAVIFVQIVLTHKAGGAHHILMLYPFHHFLAVGAAVGFLRAVNERFRHGESAEAAASVVMSRVGGESGSVPWRRHTYNVGLGISLALAGLLLASEARVGLSYERAFNDKQMFNPRWSPVIYDLAGYVNDRDVDVIVFPDWGIHNQVFALGKAETRAKCVDLWLVFRGLDDPHQGAELYNKFFKGKRALAVLYSQDAEVMPNARQHFFAFSDYFLGRRHLEKIFLSAQGEPIFEVYHIDWPVDGTAATHD